MKKVIPSEKLTQNNLNEVRLSNTFKERFDIAQSIVSTKSNFFEKWALVCFLTILLISALGTMLIEYPDTIQAPAVFVSRSVQKEIIVKHSGKFTVQLAKNNRLVKQNEILGWVESKADYKEVTDLAAWLDSSAEKTDMHKRYNISALYPKIYSNLGELQSMYQDFVSAWLRYKQNWTRYKGKGIDSLNHHISKPEQIFEQALQTLKMGIDVWLDMYTIKAPISGKVLFIFPLHQNINPEPGKLIGYVISSDNEYFAEVNLPQNSLGRVDTGMKVQLRFDAHPYQDAGYIPGTLNYISEVSVNRNTIGTVRLDRGLITSQHLTIRFENALKARALIFTKDMSLFQRLYYSILKGVSPTK